VDVLLPCSYGLFAHERALGCYSGEAMRNHYVYKNVKGVSPHIKLAVFEEAIRREVTLKDVVGGVLSNVYGKRFQESGEKAIGVELDGDQFRLRLPRAIVREVLNDARRTKQTESSAILGHLAEHFGLIHEPVRKGRKAAV
jgi:hypothetical protein